MNDLNDKLKAIVIEPTVETTNQNGVQNSLGLQVGTPLGNGVNQQSIQPNLNGNKDFTWKLQKPGGFVSQKTAQNKNQVKAERKNSNTEPKAWLYAWLGFRHIRPEYSHQSVGQRPEQHFKCTLKVEGYEKKAFGQASSKKEAQTEAAW